VVWVRAAAKLLPQRLANDDHRPSLTGASIIDEVAEVLAKREPMYREIAARIIDADKPLAEQLLRATRATCPAT
ncbi:MAG TPA: shikimate kinase II, partial [Planctomycetes bacterium]|nr:shikimate kinase II [Planctomycetota bacterium]